MIPAQDPDSFCPRCGAAGVLFADAAFNALSRYRRGAVICSDCGRDEALHGDQTVWAIDREDADEDEDLMAPCGEMTQSRKDSLCIGGFTAVSLLKTTSPCGVGGRTKPGQAGAAGSLS